MKKVFLILLTTTFLLSCSNDDDGKTTKTAIVKLEVTNNATSNFSENVSIQITSTSSNTESLDVSGANWDDTTTSPFTKLFMKNGELKNSRVYETNQKVSTFTYSFIIKSEEEVTEPVITSLKFFVDNQLVKTEEITITDQTETTKTITVANY